jgi:hypothetical protein
MTSERKQTTMEGMIRQTLDLPLDPSERGLPDILESDLKSALPKPGRRVKLFHAWAERAQPIFERMLDSGHSVDMKELHSTLDLLVARSKGEPEASDSEYAHKSHLKDAPSSSDTQGS